MKKATSFSMLVVVALLAGRVIGEARQPPKISWIGYLKVSYHRPGLPDEAFLKGLRDLGWIDGPNAVIEYC